MQSVPVPFDATDREAVLAGVESARAALGSIDILVANVGTLPHGQGLNKFLKMDRVVFSVPFACKI